MPDNAQQTQEKVFNKDLIAAFETMRVVINNTRGKSIRSGLKGQPQSIAHWLCMVWRAVHLRDRLGHTVTALPRGAQPVIEYSMYQASRY
jgi:hypothetical protein